MIFGFIAFLKQDFRSPAEGEAGLFRQSGLATECVWSFGLVEF